MMSQSEIVPSKAEVSQTDLPKRGRIDLFSLAPYILLVVLVLAVVLLNPQLLSLQVLETKLNNGMPLLFAAVAQTLVILTGGIDLSIGGILSLSTAIASTQINDNAGSMLLWSVLILLVGIGAGAINGLIVTYMRVTPFIATLATWSVWSGVALFVLPKEGGAIPRAMKAIVQKGPILGIPKSVIILLLLIVFWLILRRTRLGTLIYSIGSSRLNTFLSGGAVRRTLILTYIMSGALAALAGLYRTIQYTTGSPTAGEPFILTSAAAVILGGTSMSGGRGGAIQSLAGALILLLINDLIYFMGISTFYTPMVQGVMLILAVAIQSLGNYLRKQRVGR